MEPDDYIVHYGSLFSEREQFIIRSSYQKVAVVVVVVVVKVDMGREK